MIARVVDRAGFAETLRWPVSPQDVGAGYLYAEPSHRDVVKDDEVVVDAQHGVGHSVTASSTSSS